MRSFHLSEDDIGSYGKQIFKVSPAHEFINLTSLVGGFYAGSAINVGRFNAGHRDHSS